jgi:Vitamin K-dependent gamma-carboxylase
VTRRFLPQLRAEPAATLAALRIAVPALILAGPTLREGVRVAALAPALRVAPEGLGWFLAWVPIRADLALVVELVTAFAALLAIAGVRARTSLAVMTAGTFYLGGLAQMTGQVWHDMHLLWLAALLAVSPCDHAFAVDARARPVGRAGAEYALPLLFARLLLGAVYFFPGFHKLHTSGLAWALSDNLENQLHWKWAEHGVVPAFRIDHHPWLLQAGGLGVLAFELGAPVLFLVPRLRVWGAMLGIAFHLGTQAVFLIPFLSLWGCYGMLFDMRAVERRVARWTRSASESESESESGSASESESGSASESESESGSASASASASVIGVGVVLLVGAVVQGLRGQMQAYPFACYPTFEYRVGTLMPDLRIVAEHADGSEREIVHARDRKGYRTQRQWGTVWSLALHGTPERLRAYYLQNARVDEAASGVRFERVFVSVRPEDRGAAPVRSEPIAELAP